ncbi:MAG TPA: OsmC family protein [Candidatus Limnocylindrales bacterium]
MRERTVELTHEGGMRFGAVTGSGHVLTFDDRADAAAPGPMETIVAALAACTAMDVVSIALKKRQGIDSYRVHASAEQRDEYPQVYTRIDLVHEVVGPGVDEAAIRRCIELSADKYCPVSAMLSAGATEVHHRYRIRNTGPEPFEVEDEVRVTGPAQSLAPIR